MDLAPLFAFFLGSSWLYVLMVIVGLGLIIFVHELGHFLVAKLCGVKCEKFYLGFDFFGLRLARFQWGETEYGIGILPLGGYVKMLGQEDNPGRLREEMERAKAAGNAQQVGQTTSGDAPQAGQLTSTSDSSLSQTVQATSGASLAGAGLAGPDASSRQTERAEPASGNSGGQRASLGATGNAPQPEPGEHSLAEIQEALYDPRSYLAKSVPQRMAIISAGVIMNLVFAFFAAVGAYWVGVKEIPCGVGVLAPGEGAWRAGLQPGDRILAINGQKTTRFQDLQQSISLTSRGQEVTMQIERPTPSGPQVIEIRLVPDRIRIIPTIGVSNPLLPVLAEPPCVPGSPAATLGQPLPGGWTVTAIEDKSVTNYADIHRGLAEAWGQPVRFTLQSSAVKQRREVVLPPMSVSDFGLVLDWGRIVAVQTGSPAEQAGVEPGDELLEVTCPAECDWRGDLMRLPYALQVALRETQTQSFAVRLRIRRPTEGATSQPDSAQDAAADAPRSHPAGELTITVPPRIATTFAELNTPDSPLEIPQLGITVEILPRVRAVRPQSPAARAGIVPGHLLLSATLYPAKVDDNSPMAELVKKYKLKQFTVRFDLERGDEKGTWPFFFRELQKTVPGSKVELTVKDGSTADAAPQTIPLLAVTQDDWFLPERGLLFQAETFDLRAESFAQAVAMGADETWESITLVYRILDRLGRGDVSPRALVGPIGMVQAAYHVASQGTGRFLLFLTLLSANLAVINFLPIPVLDGGHMMFLIYEGIRGKPPSEAVYVGLSYLGLAFILGLMLWVFGLDLGLIAR